VLSRRDSNRLKRGLDQIHKLYNDEHNFRSKQLAKLETLIATLSVFKDLEQSYKGIRTKEQELDKQLREVNQKLMQAKSDIAYLKSDKYTTELMAMTLNKYQKKKR
jgi:chromosome segregation ATPase